jgi:type I restriction enzyme S subunit
MEAWKPKKLTELAEYINGCAFKPEDWGKDGLAIIRIEQLRNPETETDYYAGRPLERNIIDNGDLIFSWSASLFLRIWQHGKAVLNQHLFKVIEKEGIHRRFLKSFIEFHLPELTKASHGSTMQHITRKELERFSALFPISEYEQTQIAIVLSTIDRAIEQTEAIIAKQQRIKTGLMQDLLTRGIDQRGNIRSEETHEFKNSPLGRIPVEWDQKELREVATILDPNPSHRYPPSADEGVPIASTENFIEEDGFDLSWSESVPFAVFEQQNERCQYRRDDVVFARKGRIGFARPYGDERKVFSHTLVLLKPRNGSLRARYLLWIVRFRDFLKQIDKRMNSNSGVPTLGVAFLGAVPVCVPTLEEQAETLSILDRMDAGIEQERRRLRKLVTVKAGLMQDLLTGKVRVTDLIDRQATS